MSFLKNFWKSSAKHKKLSEEWVTVLANSHERIEISSDHAICLEEKHNTFMNNSEISFNLKYLGSTLVETPSSEEVTAEAIKTIISMSKAGNKKLQRILLSVSLRGIRITDMATDEDQHEISMYRISYCSADATHDHVFAFIATNFNETMECHALLCPKRKMAQTVALTVAQAFNTAYEAWKISQAQCCLQEKDKNYKDGANFKQKKKKKNENESAQNKNNANVGNDKQLLIDLSCDIKTSKGTNWVYFEDDRCNELKNTNFANCEDISKSRDNLQHSLT